MQPSASSAANRRVSTWPRASRQAPITGKIVMITGSSSGSSAIDTAIPANSAGSHAPCARPYNKVTSTLVAMASPASSRTVPAIPRCKGVSPGSSSAKLRPTLPSSVSRPTAVTRARPSPSTTSVPDHRNGKLSPPGAASGKAVPAGVLPTGADSPVSSDSSTCRFWLRSSTASAAMRSPSATISKSPTCKARLSMRIARPSRHTSTCGLLSSRSACKARSDFNCCCSVRPSVMHTMKASSRPSCSSPSDR